MGGLFADNTPSYLRLLKSALYDIGGRYKYTESEEFSKLLSEAVKGGVYSFINSVQEVHDIRTWLFRVEYVPVSPKTKIRARKGEKQAVDYLQPFNQRAEVNAASAFGQNLWLTAQKTGPRLITVVKNYEKLADIPPIGALVNHNGRRYRLIANRYTLTNTQYIQVTHTLSENWSNRSKHVSVDQKYRNYNIPQDILWRNIYWEDYVTVSGDEKTSDGEAGISLKEVCKILKYNPNDDYVIDCFALYRNKAGTVVPCAAYGIANSLIFSATFEDNLYAGVKITSDTRCEDVLYCSSSGRFTDADFILCSGIRNEDADRYPVSTDSKNAPKEVIFKKKFHVDKDPGEALRFTYQVHFVCEGDCVVGNKLAENNTLVKQNGKARKFKVWLLKSYIRNGEDRLNSTKGGKSFDGTFNMLPYDSKNASIHLLPDVKDELTNAANGYVAWAITDQNDNLYIGRNENKDGFVHLCISHKRP
jgi:hypothetical protein